MKIACLSGIVSCAFDRNYQCRCASFYEHLPEQMTDDICALYPREQHVEMHLSSKLQFQLIKKSIIFVHVDSRGLWEWDLFGQYKNRLERETLKRCHWKFNSYFIVERGFGKGAIIEIITSVYLYFFHKVCLGLR